MSSCLCLCVCVYVRIKLNYVVMRGSQIFIAQHVVNIHYIFFHCFKRHLEAEIITVHCKIKTLFRKTGKLEAYVCKYVFVITNHEW